MVSAGRIDRSVRLNRPDEADDPGLHKQAGVVWSPVSERSKWTTGAR
jgi:hypothetical protein